MNNKGIRQSAEICRPFLVILPLEIKTGALSRSHFKEVLYLGGCLTERKQIKRKPEELQYRRLKVGRRDAGGRLP